MSNAGYGNHDAPKPGSAGAPGATDRPGMDLGGAKDRSTAEGAMAGRHSQPDPTGAGPHSGLKDSNSPVLSDDDRRQVSTPGDGAGPAGPQGNEVDPGTG